MSRIFKLKIDIGPREGSGSEQTSCRYIKNFKIAVMMGDVNRYVRTDSLHDFIFIAETLFSMSGKWINIMRKTVYDIFLSNCFFLSSCRCCISLCLASPLAVRQKNKSNEIQSQNIVCLDTAGREDKKVLNRDRKLLYFLESSLSTPNELKMAILTDFLDFNLFDSIHDMGTEEGKISFFLFKILQLRTI